MTLSWIDEPSALGATRHYRMKLISYGGPAIPVEKDVYAQREQLPAFAHQFLVSEVNAYCQAHAGSPPNATKLTACLKGNYAVRVVDALTHDLVGEWSGGAWHPAPVSTDIVAYERHPSPHPSAPGPMVPGCPQGTKWDPATKQCKPERGAYGVFGPPSAPPPMIPGGRHLPPTQPSEPPPFVPPMHRWQPQPSEPTHSAPPPFPCPVGTSWNGSECAPLHRGLGFTFPVAVNQAHAKGVLLLWSKAPGVSPPISDYSQQDVLTPGWTWRDGAMLHAFAKWWTGAPKVAWQSDPTDPQNGVVVAQLTDAHLAALDAWAASQGMQVPGAQAVDMAASRALLVLWGKTDGRAVALDDYGLNPADLAPAWSSRDTAMLKLFQTWWNEQGKPALGTDGALDVASSIALKQWVADRLAQVPSGWTAPGAQPSGSPPPKCSPSTVWDEINKVCQPLPAGVVVTEPPASKGSSTVWWVLGGLAVAGGALWYFARGAGVAVGAPSTSENPRIPTKNIYWKDIKPNDRVELVGHTYVVTKPGGKRFTAYWMGEDVPQAQRWLESRLPSPAASENPSSKEYRAGYDDGFNDGKFGMPAIYEKASERDAYAQGYLAGYAAGTESRLKKPAANENPATEKITSDAVRRLGSRLGFEGIKLTSHRWLVYGRKHPSSVSVRVRPGANEGRIVEVYVTPRGGRDLTPYERSQYEGQSLIVLWAKTFGSREEAWNQAGALVRSLISGHRTLYGAAA